MSPLDAVLGFMLVVLCGHVGILLVALARGFLPQRRHPDRITALSAGAAALVGELLALRGILGKPAPLAWVAGLLALGVLLGLFARGAWKEHPVGRAAFHAVVAAPLVVLFTIVLNLR